MGGFALEQLRCVKLVRSDGLRTHANPRTYRTMDGALEETIGAAMQLLAACILVALFYLGHRLISSIRAREATPFRSWIGLVKPTDSLKGRLVLVVCLALFSVVMSALERLLGFSEALSELVQTGPVAQLGQIEPTGAAMLAGVSYAFVRTAGSEELLIRGLLYKRLITCFGVGPANLIQALLFTLIHNGLIVLAMPDAPWWLHADIFLRIFVLSWVVGWYMERRDNGSLLMPWICHGIANLLTFLSFFLG